MKLNRPLIILPAAFVLAAVCTLPVYDNYASALMDRPTQADISEARHGAYEQAKAAGEVGFEWKHGDKSSSLVDGVLTASWSGEVVNRETAGMIALTLDNFDEARFTADELDDTEVRIRVTVAEDDTRVWNGSLRDFAVNGKLADEMRSDQAAYVQGGGAVAFDLRITTAPTAQPYTPMTELPNLDVAVHHLY